MASLNKVFIIGNLTRDPELRYTPGGTAVTTLRVATNRRYKDKNGEPKEEVCFLTAITWDKQAEVCNQYLHKGSPLFLEGRLQYRSWDGPDGKKRSTLEVRVERVQFLGTPSGAKAAPAAEASAAAPAADEKTDNASFNPGGDEVSWGGQQDAPEETS